MSDKNIQNIEKQKNRRVKTHVWWQNKNNIHHPYLAREKDKEN